MSDNKKYYYLKLKEDFFDSDAMIVMESMPDGYKYSNILLKLYLRSLKHEGKLMFNDRIPYNSTILSQVTRHSVGDVERAIKVFEEMNLIEILDNGAIFISDIQNFVGRSSTEGDRKREYRRRIEEEREQLKLTGQTSGQMSDKRPPEIEIELEKELETDKDHSSAKLTERFEALWKLYPRKQGKKDALKHYKRAVKEGTTDDEIEAGIQSYVGYIEKNSIDKRYVKHGSAWFNQEGWLDEYTTENQTKPSGNNFIDDLWED